LRERRRPLPRGRHSLPKEVAAAEQRERLVEAMLAAVAERGYQATSVADVIGRAGISRTTFYELFADKEDCFLAAYDSQIERLLTYVNAAYGTDGSWPERVQAGLSALLETLAMRRDEARVTMVEVMGAGPRAHERYRAAVRAFVPFFEDGTHQTPRGAELPPRVPWVVVGGLASRISEQVIEGDLAGLPRLLPELVYTALVPYLDHDGALREMRKARRTLAGVAFSDVARQKAE
jgi:AcrR family transcriptional regulator